MTEPKRCLYRIEFAGGRRHVIAVTLGEALRKWRERTAADAEPETVSRVDDDEVIQ